MNIKIYSTPTCLSCMQLKQYLKTKKIDFTDLDVTADEKKAQEMVQRSNQTGVPVIDINGRLIIGFNKLRVDEELKKMKQEG